MLSNSDRPTVRSLYRGFRIDRLAARRYVNSDSRRRGPVGEVIVTNFRP